MWKTSVKNVNLLNFLSFVRKIVNFVSENFIFFIFVVIETNPGMIILARSGDSLFRKKFFVRLEGVLSAAIIGKCVG